MQVGTGKSVLNGIAIGKLKIYKKKDTAISAAEVADTAAEVARFEEAQQKAIEQQTALYEKALAEAGEDIVFVLGDPDYYRRLGFDASLARHFDAPWSGPAFMARALDRPRDATDRPKIDYPPAFDVFG